MCVCGVLLRAANAVRQWICSHWRCLPFYGVNWIALAIRHLSVRSLGHHLSTYSNNSKNNNSEKEENQHLVVRMCACLWVKIAVWVCVCVCILRLVDFKIIHYLIEIIAKQLIGNQVHRFGLLVNAIKYNNTITTTTTSTTKTLQNEWRTHEKHLTWWCHEKFVVCIVKCG